MTPEKIPKSGDKLNFYVTTRIDINDDINDDIGAGLAG